VTSATTTAPADASTDLDQNRGIAIDFLKQASAGHAREAMRRYAAPTFVHHNPWFASDADSLAAAMDDNARANPDKELEILRTIADGRLVAVHSRVRHTPDQAPAAVVHIFRIVEGQIHELWDVVQEAPADSPNRAGIF
jgi:predicted SnoaL-like aldol condensation-catalyzing enzyme